MRIWLGTGHQVVPSGWTVCKTPEEFMLCAIGADPITEVAFVDDLEDLPAPLQTFRWLVVERITSGRPWPKKVYFTSPNKATLARVRSTLRNPKAMVPKTTLALYRLPTD